LSTTPTGKAIAKANAGKSVAKAGVKTEAKISAPTKAVAKATTETKILPQTGPVSVAITSAFASIASIFGIRKRKDQMLVQAILN